jgi:hypothetical protein
MTAAASKNICPTDIIAYRANCIVFVEMHERPRVLLLSVLCCTLPMPRTLRHLPVMAPRQGTIELKCNVTALAISATLRQGMQLWGLLQWLLKRLLQMLLRALKQLQKEVERVGVGNG